MLNQVYDNFGTEVNFTLNPFVFDRNGTDTCFDEDATDMCVMEQKSMCLIKMATEAGVAKNEKFPGQSVIVPWLVCMDTNKDNLTQCNTQVGVKEADIDSCLKSDGKALLKEYLERGEAAGIRGTPTIFVNGVQIKTRTYDNIKKALCAADNGMSGCSSSVVV